MKKKRVLNTLIIIIIFFNQYSLAQDIKLINYYKIKYYDLSESYYNPKIDTINLDLYQYLSKSFANRNIILDQNPERNISRFIELKEKEFKKELVMNPNLHGYYSILSQLIREKNNFTFRVYLYDDLNNKLKALSEKNIERSSLQDKSYIKTFLPSLSRQLIKGVNSDHYASYDELTKFEDFIFPFVVEYRYYTEEVSRRINKTPNKLFYIENLLNSIPEAYQYYMNSDFYTRLDKLDIKLNRNAEEQYRYCKDLDKRFSVNTKIYRKYKRFCRKHNRKKQTYENYVHSRAFLKAITLFAEYQHLPEKKSIDSVYQAAIDLQKVFDTAYLTSKEERIWRRYDLDFREEKDYLIQQIKNEKFMSNYIKKADDHVKNERFDEALKLYQYCLKHSRSDKVKEKINKTIDKRNNLYQARINQADSLAAIDSIKKAVQNYRDALAVYPNRNYPKSQLLKLDKDYHDETKQKYKKLGENIEEYLQTRFRNFAYKKNIPVTYVNVFREGINDEKIRIELSPIKDMPYEEILELDFNEFQQHQDNTYAKNLNISQYRLGEYQFNESEELNKLIMGMLVDINNDLHNVITRKGIKLSFLGNADGTPFKGRVRYDKDEIGDIDNHIVCKMRDRGCEKFKKLIKGDSDQKNLALAYLRAYTFKKYIDENLHGVIRSKEIFANTSEDKGGHKRFAFITISFEVDYEKFIDENLEE